MAEAWVGGPKESQYGFVGFKSERERDQVLRQSKLKIHGQYVRVLPDTRESRDDPNRGSVVDEIWALYADFTRTRLADLQGPTLITFDPGERECHPRIERCQRLRTHISDTTHQAATCMYSNSDS